MLEQDAGLHKAARQQLHRWSADSSKFIKPDQEFTTFESAADCRHCWPHPIRSSGLHLHLSLSAGHLAWDMLLCAAIKGEKLQYYNKSRKNVWLMKTSVLDTSLSVHLLSSIFDLHKFYCTKSWLGSSLCVRRLSIEMIKSDQLSTSSGSDYQ